jgi:hypothetical protein
MKGSSSNKGWHQRWFYLRSDANMPLPPYTSRFFEEAPARWGYGPIASDKEKIDTLLQAVKRLVNEDVTGAGVIAVFHERRVLPLMRWARAPGRDGAERAPRGDRARDGGALS